MFNQMNHEPTYYISRTIFLSTVTAQETVYQKDDFFLQILAKENTHNISTSIYLLEINLIRAKIGGS
jgi:hypothetical protein